ncbi:uncharacterized protein LOC107046609 [Diachasma alloeum]|uniref:uncharacterized protein LOC107046609 n=1 Tax=Diachasma alloeum TaxID=454923 RepID=UPI000738379A|nr:uncharacterized protein LOC107046609 [Diachasma alloeum]
MEILKIDRPHDREMRVCSLHFSTDDYIKRAAPESSEPHRKRLKTGVLPSFHQPAVKTITNLNKDRGHLNYELHTEDYPERGEQSTCEASVANQCVSTSCDADVQVDVQVVKFDAAIQLHRITRDVAVQVGNNMLDAITQTSIPQMHVDKGMQTDSSLVDAIIQNETDLSAFTGLTSFALLTSLVICVTELKKTMGQNLNDRLDVRKKILLTFIKLKWNLSYVALSGIFKVSRQTCKNYFNSTLRNLSDVFSPVVRWPQKEEILENIPRCFQKYYSTRVVLDCTEIPVAKSKCLKCRFMTYSHYKGTHTVKFMIGVTPSGLISFLSKSFGGRASDKQIFSKSGILELMIPNVDSVMVDKGFLIDVECARYGVKMIRPPFLRKNKQFTKAEAEATARIAATRVHVERTIQRIKIFKILQGILPHHLVKISSKIMTVICGVTNLGNPILAEDKF